jgi:hypothetical protein
MSKYCSVIVAVLAAATMPIAAQAADARVLQERQIAPAFVAGSGNASGARSSDCFVAPCPSPKPRRECDNVVYNGSVWEVAELRVPCGVARDLVLKLLRANRSHPGPALPGWNCHDAKGVNVQGHCEDSSSPKGKVRAIFWWLDEGGGEQPPPRPPRDRGGWRTVFFEAKDPDTNAVGAWARVSWAIRSSSTPGGGTLRTLEYYGTVYDMKGDGHHARILRVNDRSGRWEIAKATSGNSTGFGSKSDPLETSLPSHFSVCIYEEDSSIACTDKFRDAVRPRGRKQGARLRWNCDSPWMDRVSTVGWGRGFVAHIAPTESARREGDRRAAQRGMWRDFELCVRLRRYYSFGMNGDQLHMLRLQLNCHAWFAAWDKRTGGSGLLGGGPTWDLEANTPKMSAEQLYREELCDTQ